MTHLAPSPRITLILPLLVPRFHPVSPTQPLPPPSPPPEGRGRILLICFEMAAVDHTGAFRWRAMVRDLAAVGWRFDILAARREDPAPRLPAGVELIQVDGRWPLSELRRRRRERYAQAALETMSQTASADRVTAWRTPASSCHPASPEPEAVGERMSLLETVHATLIGIADLLDGLVWVRRARRVARRLAKRYAYDAVIATSPLHLTHLVASDAAARHRIAYIADYRDPWYFGRGPGLSRIDPVSSRLWRRWELRSLARARAVVDISEGAQRAAVDALPPKLARLPRFYIANGYDPASDPACVKHPTPASDGRFRVAYVGWLWPFMPLPALLVACGEFRRRRGLSSDHFELQLIGVDAMWQGQPVRSLVAGVGLHDCSLVLPRVPREEARRSQERAAVRVAFDSVCAHGICIPSKLYHAARSGGAILAIGRIDGAMAHEARKIGVETFDPGDVDGIVCFLEDAHQRFLEGHLDQPVDRLGLFDSRHRSREMGQLLVAVTRGEAALRVLERRGFDPEKPQTSGALDA